MLSAGSSTMSDFHRSQYNGISCKGISLTELIIASTLSILIIVTVLKVYVNAQHSSRTQTLNRQIQENGRFALKLIGEDIQMAGYHGLSIRPSTIDTSATDSLSTQYGCGTAAWAANVSESVFAADNTNPYIDTCISESTYTDATDILVVRHTAGEPIAASAIKEHHLYLYTSLTDGASFRADNSGKINDTTLETVTEIPVGTYKLSTNVYYIRPCSSVSAGNSSRCSGDSIPTLVRQTLTANGSVVEPLVEYIENMQVTLGIDTGFTSDFTVDRYVSPAAVSDWEKVIVARIDFLVRSPDKVTGYDHSRTYKVGQESITKRDGYYRKVFTNSFFIRNLSLDNG